MASKRQEPKGPQATRPFWREKSLAEMSEAEWEALCDGCGRCCLNKLEYADTGEVLWTNVACRLFDEDTCRCSDYPNRQAKVADCIALTAENVPSLTWLPPTCAYRLIAEGQDLYWWHPLVSGDASTVHEARISVRGRTFSEADVAEEDLEDHVVAWPGKTPGRRVAATLGRKAIRAARRK